MAAVLDTVRALFAPKSYIIAEETRRTWWRVKRCWTVPWVQIVARSRLKSFVADVFRPKALRLWRLMAGGMSSVLSVYGTLKPVLAGMAWP